MCKRKREGINFPTTLCKKIKLSSYIWLGIEWYRMAQFFFFVFSFISFMRMPNALYHYRTNKLALFRGNGKFNKFKLKYLSELEEEQKKMFENFSSSTFPLFVNFFRFSFFLFFPFNFKNFSVHWDFHGNFVRSVHFSKLSQIFHYCCKTICFNNQTNIGMVYRSSIAWRVSENFHLKVCIILWMEAWAPGAAEKEEEEKKTNQNWKHEVRFFHFANRESIKGCNSSERFMMADV